MREKAAISMTASRLGSTPQGGSSRREEFAANWRTLLASFVGITTGAWSIPVYIISPLVAPLQQEFGWSRSGIVACYGLLCAGAFVGSPIAGALADRIGVRPVVISSMLMLVICLGALSFIGPQIWQLQTLYFLIGFLGSGTGGVTHTRAIGACFVRGRGLAISIVLAGTGIGIFIAPYLVTFLTNGPGWRAVGGTIAAIVLLIGLPVVLLNLKGGDATGLGRLDRDKRDAVAGLSIGEAFRTTEFYLLVATAALYGLFIGSLLTNIVPILVDGGLTPLRAAAMASITGLSLMTGRVGIGFLLDVLPAALIGAAMFLIGAVGIWIYLSFGAVGAIAMTAALGLLMGAEVDLLSYLTIKYCGLRHYGLIFGIITGCSMVLQLATPLVSETVMGYGGYQAILSGASASFVAAALLFVVLALIKPKPGLPSPAAVAPSNPLATVG